MKKAAITCVLFLLTFGVAGASSVNGEFDGNPVVKVQSGGQDLKVEDVPATIYKGRTVVPVYLLKQLGAEVAWNPETYTVSVSLPAANGDGAGKPDPSLQERQLLSQAYGWLKDTDEAICMFVDELQQYSVLDSTPANTAMLEEDSKRLSAAYNESLQMSLKITDQVKNYADLRSITASELKVLDQVTQVKNLLQLKQSTGSSDIAKSFSTAWLNAYRAAQQNLLHTSDIIHKLQAQEMHMTK